MQESKALWITSLLKKPGVWRVIWPIAIAKHWDSIQQTWSLLKREGGAVALAPSLSEVIPVPEYGGLESITIPETDSFSLHSKALRLVGG